MPNKTNELFARLNLADFQLIERHIRTVEFQQGFVLAHTHQLIQSVYFPHSGIISCVVEARNGDAIETGMIGKDGVFGAGQAYDHKVSLNKAMIQVPGTISVMDSNKVREIGDAIPSFRALLMDYDQFLFGQVQQSAACNALHHVEPRMCRWLLRMHELAGPDLPLTQEFLAQMMGVRRTSVTGVAQNLQKEGLISYARGHVRILDVEAVRRRSCECEEDVRSHHRVIFGNHGSGEP